MSLFGTPTLHQIRKNELKNNIKQQKKTLSAMRGHLEDHTAVIKLEQEHNNNTKAIASLKKQIAELTA